MDPKSDTGEFYEGLGEVRFFEERGIWHYSHARGQRTGFASLEEAKADVAKAFRPLPEGLTPPATPEAPSET